MNALLITTDLMASSAAEGAARAAGATLRVVPPSQSLDAARAASARVVAIDLTAKIDDLAELIAALREAAPGVAVVAYGPHVHEARLAAARDAGCDLVMSRGQFHRGFGEVLARYASEDAG
ncbi:MAG: DNA-binding response regulator [Planctomycetota bacterium]